MGDPKKEKTGAKAKPTDSESNVEELVKKVLSKIDDLSKQVDKNSKTCQEKFDSSEFVQGELGEKFDKFTKEFKELKEEFKEVKKENVEMKTTIASLSDKIREYDEKFEMQEREKKRANLSIDGVLEIENLSLEKLMNDLFEDLSLDYKVADVCNKIYRKGKFVTPTAGNMPRPRPIIVELYDASFKYEVFKNLKNMAGKEKWRNIYINDDLTADQSSKMKDMRSINGYARSVGMETKIRGTKLFVKDKKFGLNELDKVPEEIGIEKAKTIEVNGAVIFQGHHSYLSNMSESKFEYEGKSYNNAETAFQFKKASTCGKKEEAKQILKMSDPYAAKRTGRNIKETEEWKKNKEKTMKEILEAKFNQNEEIKRKLVDTGNKKLLEGTSDKYWGCGLPIAKYKSLNPKSITGKNVLGQMLSEIRKKISKSEK